MAKLELDISTQVLDNLKGLNSLKEGVQDTAEAAANLKTGFDSAAKAGSDLDKVLKINVQQLDELQKKLAKDPGNKGLQDAIKLRKENIDALKKHADEQNKLTNNVQKEVSGIAGLRREYKQLIAEYLAAEKAGNKALSQQLLVRAGKIKDQIGDIAQATKTVGTETFAFDALNQGAQTVAASFQIAIGAKALFGTESEELQRTLVRLNAVMAITNGLQQISNALQKESAFSMGISKVATFAYAGAQATLGKAFNTSSQGARAFSAALSANAIGALLLIITTIITFREEIFELFSNFKEKSNGMKAALIAIGVVLSGSLLPLIALVVGVGKLIDAIVGGSTKANKILSEVLQKNSEAVEKAAADQIKSITRRYDLEIGINQALGKSTLALEESKKKAILATLRVQEKTLGIQALVAKSLAAYTEGFAETAKELDNKLKEISGEIIDTENDITINQVQQEQERITKGKEALDARKEAYKKAADDIIAIVKKASDAELSLLTGQERIDAIKARNSQELETLKNQFQEANKVIAKATNDQALQELANRGELTREQYEAIRLIKNELDKQELDAELAFERTKQDARISVMKEGTEKELEQLKQSFADRQKEIITLFGVESQEYKDFTAQRSAAVLEVETKGSLESLALQEQIAKDRVDTTVIAGETEVEATRRREQQKLEIEIEFAQERLALLTDSAAADGLIDEKERASITALQANISQAQGELVESKKKTAEELNKIDIFKALFPGLEPGQLDAVKNAIKQVYDSIIQIVSDALDASIEANQEIIDNLNERIDETQDNIANELEANKQGLANNLDAEKENLAKLQAERQKALEEQKKLAKQKEALETVQQAISLITASASIFASLAPLGPVGVGIAVATIAAMIAAFIAGKATAKSAAGFKDGVIDLKGPGTSKSDSIPANLSKGESVMTAKETSDHLRLLKAIRSGVPAQIHAEMLRELLENTGVTLPEASLFRSHFMNNGDQKTVVVTSDNKDLRKELQKSNKHLMKIEENTDSETVIFIAKGLQTRTKNRKRTTLNR